MQRNKLQPESLGRWVGQATEFRRLLPQLPIESRSALERSLGDSIETLSANPELDCFQVVAQPNRMEPEPADLRLVWWPNGKPCEVTVGIVSSRLGRNLDDHRDWFAALRNVVADCAQADFRLVLSPPTFAGPYVARAASLFGAKTLTIQTPNAVTSLESWIQESRQDHAARFGANHDSRPAYVSPPISGNPAVADAKDCPLQDEMVFQLSQRLCAIHVRSGGNIHNRLLTRLVDVHRPPASVHLRLGSRGVSPKLRDQLLDAGAVGWATLGWGRLNEQADVGTSTSMIGDHELAEQTLDRGGEMADFLTHCTRRRHGPWPEQTEREFLDDLILDRPDAVHSALASLLRILKSRKLIATGDTIRGGFPVVSFTEVSAAELQRLRVFRPHRGRWDFQPYGLSIRRAWLVDHGCRAVRYAEEHDWKELPDAERPFFQKSTSPTKGGGEIQWTVEQEWRHPGDIDLECLGGEDAFVFVPNQQAATAAESFSRWPIRLVSPS